MTSKSWLRWSVVPLIVTAGCRDTSSNASEPLARLPVLEQTAIQAIAEDLATRPESIVRSGLRSYREASAAVPGLIYHHFVYEPPKTGDMESATTVIQTADTVRLLKTASDIVIAHRYFAATATGAITLCSELARFSIDPTRSTLGVLYADDRYWQKLGWRSATSLSERVSGPHAQASNGRGWAVTLWVAEPGQMTQYTCELDSAATPRIRATDSAPGAGLRPSSP